MATYNLFISHSWSYGGDYNRLTSLLDAKLYFSYANFSVPRDDPIHTQSNAVLRQAILNKIRLCHVVVIMAGVYSTYSRWINIEIELAQSGFANPKPILAVKPRGNINVSRPVALAAGKIVNWNTDSIVAGIRELAR